MGKKDLREIMAAGTKKVLKSVYKKNLWTEDELGLDFANAI